MFVTTSLQQYLKTNASYKNKFKFENIKKMPKMKIGSLIWGLGLAGLLFFSRPQVSYSENLLAEQYEDSVRHQNQKYNKSASQLSLEGLTILKTSSVEKSKPYFEKALNINKKNPIANLGMGMYLLKQGDVNKSLRFLKKALINDSYRSLDDSLKIEILREITRAYEMFGDYHKAEIYSFSAFEMSGIKSDSLKGEFNNFKWSYGIEPNPFPQFKDFSIEFGKEMTIEAKVNDSTANLIFDTGNWGDTIIDSTFAEEIGLIPLKELDGKGISIIKKLEINGIVLERIPVIIRPWYKNGSLGMNLFKNVNFTLDFKDSSITFFNPTENKGYVSANEKNTIEIPFHVSNGLIMINASVGDGQPSDKWIIDSGFQGAISFNTSYLKKQRKVKLFGCVTMDRTDIGGVKTNLFCKSVPELRTNGVIISDKKYADACDYGSLEKKINEEIRGLLGTEAFSGFSSLTLNNINQVIVCEKDNLK